jgi:hypothetical protein
VFGTSKHTDYYIRNNNQRANLVVLQIFAILVAGSKTLCYRAIPYHLYWFGIAMPNPPAYGVQIRT